MTPRPGKSSRKNAKIENASIFGIRVRFGPPGLIVLDIEANGARFHCADQFIGLCDQAGLTDLWRLRHGVRREWTWRSAKNGFRIDHAFGNQAFVNLFPNYRCEIDHEPRLMGLTDHSAVIVDLE
jgi:exonuclease III